MAAEAPPPFNNTDFNKLQMSTSAMNEWFDATDLSGLLNQEVIMDFSTNELTPDVTPTLQFYTPSPEVFVASDSSAYSSDSSETHSPFDQFSTDSIHSGINSPIDDTLFESYNLTDPLLVPEIEKILASNPYQIDIADNTLVPDNTTTAPSKKRQRDTTAEAKSPVTLSREQLLTMTSSEIEDYVSSLKSKRNLTAAEEKELKRQRRLVKNREYASQSRSRKKQFVDDLEKQLEVARAEAEQYKKQNHILLEENKILKRQLGSIANTIKKVQQNGGSSSLSSSASSVSTSSSNLSASSGAVGVFEKLVKVGAGRTSSNSGKGISACLLAIFFMVFTFAAFWDNDSKFGAKDGMTFGGRTILAKEISTDPSVWEQASSLLRESWISTSLPSWESAFSVFASSTFSAPSSTFTPSSIPSTTTSSSPSSMPSTPSSTFTPNPSNPSNPSVSVSSDSSIPIPMISEQLEKIVPLKPFSSSVPHPPPASLPQASKPCNVSAS